MGKMQDIPRGAIFSRLTTLEHVHAKDVARGFCMCVCSCGATKNIRSRSLWYGKIKSCGCLQNEHIMALVASLTKHGKAGTRVYISYKNMMKRCYSKKSKDHYRYGGRGIGVCLQWHEFEAFYRDMGDPAPGYTLGRIDNDGGYSKDNCRWETKEQQLNNTRYNVNIEFNGVTKTMTQWSKVLGLNYSTIKTRIARGWSPNNALNVPTHRIGSPYFNKKRRGNARLDKA